MKKKLSKKEQQRFYKKTILSHFNEKKLLLYYEDYINSTFRDFQDDNYLSEYNISLHSSNHQFFFSHGLSIHQVEKLILEIGLPNRVLDAYKEGLVFYTTIFNNHIRLSYNTDLRPVESEQDCLDYCESIITYMETGGKAFVERYSYLPHILEEMDKNTLEGINWSYGVFSGTAGAFFKGLLISKLCNDVNFNEKIELVDNIYYPVEHNLQEFIPYYEKLKERLKTIEPIYNC